MDTQIVHILKQIKADHDENIFLNRSRFNALLKDYTKGQYKGETRFLVTALDEGLYRDLLDNPADYSQIRVRYMMKFKTEFWTDEQATFAIDAWAVVAGIAINSNRTQSTGQNKLHSSANMGKKFEVNRSIGEAKEAVETGTGTNPMIQSIIPSEFKLIAQLDSGVVQSVAYSPDGRYFVSVTRKGFLFSKAEIKIWDTTTYTCIKTLTGHSTSINSVAYSPDGSYLASGSGDKTVKIWDTTTYACIKTLTGHSDGVKSVAYSPDGMYLASGSVDNTLKVWDTTTYACIKTLTSHSSVVHSVAYSQDGMYLASASSGDSIVIIWDTTTYTEIKRLRCIFLIIPSSIVSSVAYSPDGELVALLANMNETVRLLDVDSGKQLPILDGHKNTVSSIAFSPDGRLLASGSFDHTVKIWDTTTYTCIKTLTGHSANVKSVAYSPDGRYIASGSWDKTVRIWEIP
ncbi:MAG: WD40 repeat domain-containing protein [Desulfitobacteriaceae bacterium]